MVKSLTEQLRGESFNNDNLHRIAISNLNNSVRQIERWWTKKYRTPLKDFHDHTIEELVIERLEDFYYDHPQEIERFYDSLTQEKIEWDGRTDENYEREMQAKWKKINEKNQIDTSKYKSDEELTPEQEKKILEDLGMGLKNSSKSSEMKNVKTLGEDEIDESF